MSKQNAYFTKKPEKTMQNVKCMNCYSYTSIYHMEWDAIICRQCKGEIDNPNTIAQRLAERFSFNPDLFNNEEGCIEEIALFELGATWISCAPFVNPTNKVKGFLDDVYVFSDGSYIAVKNEPFPSWEWAINKQSSVFCGCFIN